MRKLIKCKSCNADVAKDAKACPHCGGKIKKTNPVLGSILLVIGLLLLFSFMFGTEESPEKIGEVTPTFSVEQEEKEPEKGGASLAPSVAPSMPAVYGVGDKVEMKNVVVTFLGVTESNGDNYFEPDEGKTFVICEFEIENNSKEEIGISSMLSFSAYFDDYATNVDIYAMSISDKPQLDGSIASGKKMKGIVGFQADQSWSELEIHFVSSVWSSKYIAFSYEK